MKFTDEELRALDIDKLNELKDQLVADYDALIAELEDQTGAEGAPEDAPEEAPEDAPDAGDDGQRSIDEIEQDAKDILAEQRRIAEIISEKNEEARKEAEKRKALEDIKGGKKDLRGIEKTKEKDKMDKLGEMLRSRDYAEAYADLLRTGDNARFQQRANTILGTDLTASTAGSKIPVPEVLANAIQTAWDENGQLLAECTRLSVNGVLHVPYEASTTDAVVHVEGSAAPDSENIQIGKVTIEPQTIKKWVLITDEYTTMDAIDFLGYVGREIAYKIMDLLETQIVTAVTGAAAPFAAAVTTAPAFDAFFKGLAELGDTAKNPIIVMNRKTYFNSIMTLVDGANRPIYDIVSANGKPDYMINGVRVVFSDALDEAAAGKTWAIVGDFSGVTVNFPGGQDVSTITDPYSLAEQDILKIVGKLFAGVGVTGPEHFAVLTQAAS